MSPEGMQPGAVDFQDHGRRDVGWFPLVLSPAGGAVRIEAVSGGRGVIAHLAALGLYVGAQVTVLNPGRPGPMILSYGGTRLAVGQGMAMQILVSSVGDRTR